MHAANTLIFAALFVPALFFAGILKKLAIITAIVYAITHFARKHLLSPRLPVNPNAAVLVTGCSTGIGRDAALRLAGKGFTVFATVRRAEDAKFSHEKIIPVVLDVTKEETMRDAFEMISKTLKDQNRSLYAIVHNAGYSDCCPLEMHSMQSIRLMFETNIFGHIALTQIFLPLLREAPFPNKRIVFISSGLGTLTAPGAVPYSATKHAMESFAAGLRMELKHWNILVSVVAPGFVKTPGPEKVQASAQATIESKDSRIPADVREHYQTSIAKATAAIFKVPRQAVSTTSDMIEAALLDTAPLTRYLNAVDVKVGTLLGKFLPDQALEWAFGGRDFA